MKASSKIYLYQPDVSYIDTSKKFTILREKGQLRVKNENINCLFSHLTRDSFDEIYNHIYQHLHLDFDPLIIDKRTYSLTKKEQNKLVETIITSWIYYYTINDLPVKIKAADFTHPYMVDYVLSVLDKKYRKDTKESLALSAKILRQKITEYTKTVQARRAYYER